MNRFVLIALAAALPTLAAAQTAPADKVDAVIKTMFAKASPEWQARAVLDETQRACTDARSQVSGMASEAIQKRETASITYPADGKMLGDWKRGFQVANNGRGGQFSDGPDTVAGGNCYACHQMDPKELSYGTIGPSLLAYGKDRKYDAEAIKTTFAKIYNSQASVPCSNMPRFGTMKVLNEQQIKDVLAYLFDPESPVNK